MKKVIYLIVFFCLIFNISNQTNVFAQQQSIVVSQLTTDTIVKKGNKYYYRDIRLTSLDNIKDAVKTDEYAVSKIQEAQGLYVLTTVVSTVGGGILGWGLGKSFVPGEVQGMHPGTIMLIGLGVIGSSLLFIIPINSLVKDAVSHFNNTKKQKAHTFFKPSLNLALSATNIGLQINF